MRRDIRVKRRRAGKQGSEEERVGKEKRRNDASSGVGVGGKRRGSKLCTTAGRSCPNPFINRAIRRLPSWRLTLFLGRILSIGPLILCLTVPIIISSITPLRSSSSVRRGLSARSRRSPLLCPPTPLQNLLPVPDRPLILRLVVIKQLVLAERANPFVRRVRQRRWGRSRFNAPVSFSPRWKTGR